VNSRGKKMISKHGRGTANKRVVVALVERGGAVRSFHMVDGISTATMTDLIAKNVKKESRVHTDESRLYTGIKKRETVSHKKGEYARGDVTTNSVEGHFGIFARGLIGTYQHVGEQHLSRYLAEFDFRMSNREKLGVNDVSRANRILKGAEGKRLTYRQTAN